MHSRTAAHLQRVARKLALDDSALFVAGAAPAAARIAFLEHLDGAVVECDGRLQLPRLERFVACSFAPP